MVDIYNDVKSLDSIKSMPGFFKEIPPLSELFTIGFDIETSGLDPEDERVYMIGLILKDGTIKIIRDEDEKTLLKRFAIFFSQLISGVDRVCLYGHNVFKFDIPFIMKRCEYHGVDIGFEYKKDYKGFAITRSFALGGSYPIIYLDLTCPKTDIVDTWMLARYNDSAYLFSKQDLKTVAIEIGFRKEHRLEIGDKVKHHWALGEFALLDQYLTYDLEDSRAVFYKFVAPYYYMQSFLPMTLQETILSGNASKIESLLKRYYRDEKRPEPDDKVKYEGALTLARPGLFRKVHKFDVASQYPFIMLAYRCGTCKDPDGIFFSILKDLRAARLVYKEKGKTDNEAKAISEAMKIIINSAYGMLGSTHPYNDMASAAKVCEYGREIVKKMMSELEALGAVIIEVDTDGIMFCIENYTDEIMTKILSKMPVGLEMEHEFESNWIYVDAAKNYIIDLPGKVVRKGNFRKRNMPVLYREYVETFCRRYLESPESAELYHSGVIDSIVSRTMDVKKIAVTRTISKAEKVCLKYGVAGDKITVYRGYEEDNKKDVPVISGHYNIEFYKKQVEKWYKVIKDNVSTVRELKGVVAKKDDVDGVVKA